MHLKLAVTLISTLLLSQVCHKHIEYGSEVDTSFEYVRVQEKKKVILFFQILFDSFIFYFIGFF